MFFHQTFVTGMDLLHKSRFRYFLYGTIFWERKRKQNLDSCILTYLTSQRKHSDCLSCVRGQKQEPCNHASCQHFVFQLAMNSGLFFQGEDGCIETNVQFFRESKVVNMVKSTHPVSQTNRENAGFVQDGQRWTAPKLRKITRETNRTPYRATTNRLITPMVQTVI